MFEKKRISKCTVKLLLEQFSDFLWMNNLIEIFIEISAFAKKVFVYGYMLEILDSWPTKTCFIVFWSPLYLWMVKKTVLEG